jgi:hypothetical protein
MLNRPAIYLKILLLLLSFSMVRAQHEFDRIIDLSWADDGNAATYSAPFQGKRYIDPHRILNDKHKFFETFELQEGELIFDQDRYSGLQLKFDLFEQQLALLHPNSDGATQVAVDMNRVQAFKINHRVFVKKTIDGSDFFLEYIDKLDEKEIWVYHRKLLSFKLDNRVGYYEFNPRDRLYILSMEGWEKSDAISLENFLPNRSREIKAWSKSWQDNKKKDASRYLRALLKELNQN